MERTFVTTQAHEGIETSLEKRKPECAAVTTQAHEGIETSIEHMEEKF